MTVKIGAAIAILAVVAAALLAGPLRTRVLGPTPSSVVSPPASINTTCSSDATAALNAWLSSLPPNTTAQLGAGACYLVSGTGVELTGLRNITLVGNNARFHQTSYAGRNEVQPILRLTDDTGVEVEHLNIVGPGSSGGTDGSEGDYGVILAGNRGVLFTHDTITGVMGDFMTIWSDTHGNLNYGVTLSGNTMTGSGYHGITVEGVVGLLVDDNTISDVGNGGVDLEYDIYPTVYKPGPLGPCQLASCPTGGAEINVTFQANRWSNIGGIWIESLQGQEVTEDNLRLISNTVDGRSSISVSIRGNETRPNLGFTMLGNVATGGYFAPGGAINVPHSGSGLVSLDYVNDASVQNNRATMFDGLGAPKAYFPNTPYLSGNSWDGVHGGVIKDNVYSGAIDVLTTDPANPWPKTPNTGVTSCDNTYGPNYPNSQGLPTRVTTESDRSC
jgi:hypothetical protein